MSVSEHDSHKHTHMYIQAEHIRTVLPVLPSVLFSFIADRLEGGCSAPPAASSLSSLCWKKKNKYNES